MLLEPAPSFSALIMRPIMHPYSLPHYGEMEQSAAESLRFKCPTWAPPASSI